MSQINSYAQNREDVYIYWLLDGQAPGFYVDIGANHPVLDSVTKLFYDKGWHGINVEPIKRLHKLIVGARTRDINLNIGISKNDGKLKFREYVEADGLSTFSSSMQKTYSDTKYSDYEVDVMTLQAMLEKHAHGKTIDFMKVDVEGYEYEVLSSNNWGKIRPRLLIIEANHVDKDWRPLVKEAGYLLVFFDGLNEYYSCEESMLKHSRESYPKYMIEPIVVDYKTKLYAEEQVSNRIAESKRIYDQQINSLYNEIAQYIEKIRQQGELRKSPRRFAEYYLRMLYRNLHTRTSIWVNQSEYKPYKDMFSEDINSKGVGATRLHKELYESDAKNYFRQTKRSGLKTYIKTIVGDMLRHAHKILKYVRQKVR